MIRIIRHIQFDKWLNQLKDRQALRHITARIDRLAHGHSGDSKSLGGGVSELRIHQGPGYRVYFTRHADIVIVLLCGGDKSTQSQDIERARQLAAQWKDENNG